ncbi:MAG: peptide chain release factor N(5)-glutamine methyltransferase [Balneolaceae bacterium]|nr:peptide chain release factor N(5)-glutamine methyltransferase [Balneolaceae bacterium]
MLNVKRLDLYLKYDRPLSANELDQLRPLVKRRAQHEPLQYIIGYTDFMNARIEVSPEVLIPRIETEQLVENILGTFPEGSQLTVLDIGTGSGCIPIALKQERPDWELHALDISAEALEVAKENAAINQVEITFHHGDIKKPEAFDFDGPFDVIVSNPPYVLPEEKETLEKQVVEYEPATALFTKNLIHTYQSIIDYARQNLAEKGTLFFELHDLHAGEIKKLFDYDHWDANVEKDYEKKPRFLRASLQQ